MKLKYFLLTSFFILSPLACGPQSQNSSGTCAPNVIDSGLQLLVTRIGGSTFSFQLCAQANPSSVYTVYGAPDVGSLKPPFNVQGAWRLKNITDENGPGKPFQVTFHNGDSAFAIYQDTPDGSGGYNLDNSKVMVNARTLP